MRDPTWRHVQVRPLNERELAEGNRICTHYDEDTRQIALTVRVSSGCLTISMLGTRRLHHPGHGSPAACFASCTRGQACSTA
jgi:hypothetical protein